MMNDEMSYDNMFYVNVPYFENLKKKIMMMMKKKREKENLEVEKVE